MNDAQLNLAPSFGPAEARRLTDEVKRDAEQLWAKLLELHEGRAHEALGYSSWGEFCQEEFGFGKRHSYRLLEAGRVAGRVTNWSLNEAQARELAPLLRDEGEESVIEVWHELQDQYGEQLTAEKIRAAVEKKLKPRSSQEISERPAAAIPAASTNGGVETVSAPPRGTSALPMSERDLQRYVLDVAKARGWITYHTFDSRRSQPGFPDLILLRGERQVVAELKVGNNKPTPAQEVWLDAFHAAGAQVCVWREGDLDTIAEILR